MPCCKILSNPVSVLAYLCMGGGWAVPTSHVDYKKSPCRPVKFKKITCRLSLKPKKGCVALSILGVYTLKHA